jgi:hypothetical protein
LALVAQPSDSAAYYTRDETMVQFNEGHNRHDDWFESPDPFKPLQVPEAINVLSMAKGPERYIFLFTDEKHVELLRLLGKFASDPQLSFTWYDAAALSKKVRDAADKDKP